MSQLEHKGYVGAAELSEEDGVFHGKLAFLRDLVTYESSTAKGLAKAFRDAVDDYLADCKAEGREPDKPFKGQFNVRTRHELHRAYASIAAARGQSLNEVVTDALEKALPKAADMRSAARAARRFGVSFVLRAKLLARRRGPA